MLLLIDIGNTRIKWAMSNGDAIEPPQAAMHADWDNEECMRAFNALPRPAGVWVSNVGGERIGTIVRECARTCWGIEPHFVQSTREAAGVRNAYTDVWKLGVDRWLAMIAAYAEYRRAVCVVGIGTAATFDAVDAGGRHLGGLIVPGPRLMVSSLLENTSGIAVRAVSGSTGPDLFADNTLGAIEQGAVHAVAALAERMVDRMGELGHRPQLILTGGASAEVAPLIRRSHVVSADLVLRGLSILAQESV
ncbi:MAG TPA: type III pantothenate kinase [Steroidobacteraceae bacterium]